jgi:hypothetical protein
MSIISEVRLYREGDEEKIVELLIQSFPGWSEIENSLEYWRWKYQGWKNNPIIAVAFAGEKMIGCSHDVILNVKIGDQIFETNVGDDLATHPDARARHVTYSLLFSVLYDKL